MKQEIRTGQIINDLVKNKLPQEKLAESSTNMFQKKIMESIFHLQNNLLTDS